MNPFMYRYQYNYIRSQLSQLLQTVYFAGDYRVYAAHKSAVRDRVIGLFPDLPEPAFALFKDMEEIKGQSELNDFMKTLHPFVIPFPSLTGDDIRRLFPKVKKLPIPDVSDINWHAYSYFGWRDIATNSLFLVAMHHGELVGIRNKITPLNRPGVCCVCSRGGNDVGLVVTVTKASNYTSVGNHMCLNTELCNAAMTSNAGVEAFVNQALLRR